MATKKNITPTSSPGFLKPIKSLLDNIKNVLGYFMTVVAIGTFVWTLGVKSERKSVDTANLKNAVESLKENSKKIDTLIIIINDIKSSQANLVEGQNSLRDSYVKYLVNDPKLTKKDFMEYMQGLEFQIEMPNIPEITKSTNDTIEYKPKITVKKAGSNIK